MKRMYRAALMIIISCLFISCDNGATSTDITFIGEWNIKEGNLNQVIKGVNGEEIINMIVKYPILENKDKSEFIDEINKTIYESAQNFVMISSEYSNDADKECSAVGVREFKPYVCEQDYTVTYNKDGIISVLFKFSIDTNVIFNSISIQSSNYDLLNEKELYIEDIMGGSNEQSVVLVKDSIMNMIEADRARYYEDLDDISLREAVYDMAYYLTDQGLTCSLQISSIGPYALGNPSIVIPMDDLDIFIH